jgi:hypothetical protein
MNFINTIFVFRLFFLIKKRTKVSINFFYLILNLILSEPGIISISDSNQKLRNFIVVSPMYHFFFDGNKDILVYFFFLHMKNLTDSCKTKVKHTPTSCQRRLCGFQLNTTSFDSEVNSTPHLWL